MPTKAVKKECVIDYKTINPALRKKRDELKKIQSKVVLAAKLDIELQIKAMDLLISRCRGKMSKAYKCA